MKEAHEDAARRRRLLKRLERRASTMNRGDGRYWQLCATIETLRADTARSQLVA